MTTTDQDKTVRAAADGTVIASGPNPSYGNWVVIEHKQEGKTLTTTYGDLTKINELKVGDKVKEGDPIATIIGPKGVNSTGAHLHFEIRNTTNSKGYNDAPTINPGDKINGYLNIGKYETLEEAKAQRK